MTKGKDFKLLIRDRMIRAGQSYTKAREELIAAKGELETMRATMRRLADRVVAKVGRNDAEITYGVNDLGVRIQWPTQPLKVAVYLPPECDDVRADAGAVDVLHMMHRLNEGVCPGCEKLATRLFSITREFWCGGCKFIWPMPKGATNG